MCFSAMACRPPLMKSQDIPSDFDIHLFFFTINSRFAKKRKKKETFYWHHTLGCLCPTPVKISELSSVQ